MIFPSQARKESMALAFAELDKVDNPVICEVGRMRNPHAGESDGHSTVMFYEYAVDKSGELVSIDIDANTQHVCELMGVGKREGFVKFVNGDALYSYHDFALPNSIDLLYLDGWDLPDGNSAKNHLLCFLLFEVHIKPSGLVLIDDTGTSDLGKGKLVVPLAKLMGWNVLYQGFQTLLRKPV